MIVGIDLGTSTSEIAYLNADGKPEVIPNLDGELITPSVVHLDENNEPVVGMAAVNKLLEEPQNTFMEVKRLMGQEKLLSARGEKYTPVKIASFILRYLADSAEVYLNEKVDRAVITVPAYFTDRQRRDTIKAGELAGLTVERIINEPTAAALDYGLENLKDIKNILVYDLGGGTLDVTVLELFEGVVDVKSSCGNNALGGKDFDELLLQSFLKKFQIKERMDLSNDIKVISALKQAAEQCKKDLSGSEQHEVALPFLTRRKSKPVGFKETVLRKDFEKLIADKITSTETQIRTALSDAHMTPSDLDTVLLVGGSTRIPFVSQFLSNTLNFEPKKFVDPDLAVVRGAAIQAGIIEGTLKDGDAIILSDVCPYSLSTEVLREGVFPRVVCDILIKRNTTIPATVSKIYVTSHDYQTAVDVGAYQGESTELAENVFLDRFRLSGIPSDLAGKEQIKIIFSYDLNGILKVEAESVSNSGVKGSITINTANAGKKQEVEIIEADLNNWNSAPNASKYKNVIRRAEKLIEDEDGDNGDDLVIENLKGALEELKMGLIHNLGDIELEDLKDNVLDVISELD
ncbi:MAG: Hsp70 family protein [Clostridiales bacterium]|nr:Hsp70 family protein [Clostridiales bacterium]